MNRIFISKKNFNHHLVYHLSQINVSQISLDTGYSLSSEKKTENKLMLI